LFLKPAAGVAYLEVEDLKMARRSGHAKKIDNVHWTLGTFAANALAAGTAAANVFSAQHLPETLLRLRGSVGAVLDGTNAPGIGIAVSMGLILVPEGTSTTVLWDPATDGDAPWIWYHTFHLFYDEAVVDAVQYGGSHLNVQIDNKAMRRIRNQEIQFVVNNATVQATSEVNVAGTVRALFGN